MATPFQALLQAIVENDVPQVESLLLADPALAVAGAEEVQLETRIAHWIYVKDTGLHVAAAGYRVEIATLLLAAGSNPNAARNHRRGRPLHYAADGYLENPEWDPERQVAMIQLLLQAGAEIDAPDKNGATALHRAVRTRCAAAVACLLEAGSDHTLRNMPGSTPFHLAVRNTGRGGSGSGIAKEAQLRIIRLFRDRGVPVDLPDGNGKTVWQWATGEVIRRLLIPSE